MSPSFTVLVVVKNLILRLELVNIIMHFVLLCTYYLLYSHTGRWTYESMSSLYIYGFIIFSISLLYTHKNSYTLKIHFLTLNILQKFDNP